MTPANMFAGLQTTQKEALLDQKKKLKMKHLADSQLINTRYLSAFICVRNCRAKQVCTFLLKSLEFSFFFLLLFFFKVFPRLIFFYLAARLCQWQAWLRGCSRLPDFPADRSARVRKSVKRQAVGRLHSLQEEEKKKTQYVPLFHTKKGQ